MTSIRTSDVVYKYTPIAGSASFLAFSVNVMHPALFKSLFDPYELIVANSLWFNSHFGVGLYMYRRRHMRAAAQYQRIIYSVFGTALFNFGAVLFWATTKSLLPDIKTLRIVFGLGTGAALLGIGKHYIEYLDEQTASKKE